MAGSFRLPKDQAATIISIAGVFCRVAIDRCPKGMYFAEESKPVSMIGGAGRRNDDSY
jgi:hypothetical protein